VTLNTSVETVTAARKITGTDLRFMPLGYHGLLGARCIN
jgi:hypothetical protein